MDNLANCPEGLKLPSECDIASDPDIMASGERRAASGERRAASGERRAASGERRAASGERRAASGERRAASGERRAAPFLKWAGGKRSLLHELTEHLPKSYKTYWEPFVGGGALFFHLPPTRARLSDANKDLCTCWKAVKRHPDKLIDALQAHKDAHCEQYFYHVRAQAPIEYNANAPVSVAARLIYLNKTCYNGLYRVNRSGQFNAPIGSYKSPRIVSADNIWACHKALRNSSIRCCSFQLIKPQKGDLVYADPPYDGTYTQYTLEGFTHKHQIALRDAALNWHRAGAKVMLSNSSSAFIQSLYGQKPFVIHEVFAPRPINSDKNGRSRKSEFLIRTWK